MANLQKKLNRLELLKESVLESIYKDVFESEETSIKGQAEIIHNGEIAGYVNYLVTQNVLAAGTPWSYDYPPTSDEVEFILESASVEMIYSVGGLELKNLTSAINKVLSNSEGKILNY